MKKYRERAEAWSNWFKTEDERIEFESALFFNDVTDMLLETMDRERVSRSELALKMGVKKPYITRILSGKTNLTLKSLYKCFRALEVDIEFVTVDKQKMKISVNLRREAATDIKMPFADDLIQVSQEFVSPGACRGLSVARFACREDETEVLAGAA